VARLLALLFFVGEAVASLCIMNCVIQNPDVYALDALGTGTLAMLSSSCVASRM
jgi:hypothetical protein